MNKRLDQGLYFCANYLAIMTRLKKLLPKIVSDYNTEERMILRDYLALQRTYLANERTLFSYMRSGLYLIVAAVAFLRLKDLELESLAYSLFGISLLMIVFGVVRYMTLHRKLKKLYRQGKEINQQ